MAKKLERLWYVEIHGKETKTWQAYEKLREETDKHPDREGHRTTHHCRHYRQAYTHIAQGINDGYFSPFAGPPWSPLSKLLLVSHHTHTHTHTEREREREREREKKKLKHGGSRPRSTHYAQIYRFRQDIELHDHAR